MARPFGYKMSEESKRKSSNAQKGRKLTEEHKKKLSLAKIGTVGNRKGKPGRPLTPEERKHLSNFHKGEKSHLWKGGINPINDSIRKSVEYKLWREAVFSRDNFTCVFCGERGGKLNADHIKPFAHYPELRFAIDNGRTLCVDCHKTTDTYGWKSRKDEYGK